MSTHTDTAAEIVTAMTTKFLPIQFDNTKFMAIALMFMVMQCKLSNVKEINFSTREKKEELSALELC